MNINNTQDYKIGYTYIIFITIKISFSHMDNLNINNIFRLDMKLTVRIIIILVNWALIFVYYGYKMSAYLCMGLVGIVLFFIFFIAPLVVRCFPGIVRGFIFVPQSEIPKNTDYEHPESSGFIGGRNFYLTTEDGAKLGVWHILPARISEDLEAQNLTTVDNSTAEEQYSAWLAEPNSTVWLYMHGSAGTRTSTHRLRLYKLISQLNYHLIAFDYRGYGDSTSRPLCETDLITDTMTVYKWVTERVTNGNIYLWGHSLGSGVASHVADTLFQRKDPVRGIVLEAPFNNMADAVRVNPYTEVASILPWFEYCFIEPLAENDMSFNSDSHLRNITTPVLILHSRGDKIIPYKLAERLYKSVVESRKDHTTVEMVSYEKKFRYGHYNITLDPNLNNTIKLFVDKNTQWKLVIS